jgi:hypothetical protein
MAACALDNDSVGVRTGVQDAKNKKRTKKREVICME